MSYDSNFVDPKLTYNHRPRSSGTRNSHSSSVYSDQSSSSRRSVSEQSTPCSYPLHPSENQYPVQSINGYQQPTWYSSPDHSGEHQYIAQSSNIYQSFPIESPQQQLGQIGSAFAGVPQFSTSITSQQESFEDGFHFLPRDAAPWSTHEPWPANRCRPSASRSRPLNGLSVETTQQVAASIEWQHESLVDGFPVQYPVASLSALRDPHHLYPSGPSISEQDSFEDHLRQRHEYAGSASSQASGRYSIDEASSASTGYGNNPSGYGEGNAFASRDGQNSSSSRGGDSASSSSGETSAFSDDPPAHVISQGYPGAVGPGAMYHAPMGRAPPHLQNAPSRRPAMNWQDPHFVPARRNLAFPIRPLPSRLKRKSASSSSFSCPNCGDLFTRSRDVIRHLQSIHVKEGEERFACRECNFVHARSDKMYEHCRDEHGHRNGEERFHDRWNA